jgi:hypothetical protein
MAEHTQRVGARPAHSGSDLIGGDDRQWAHVFVLDRKRDRPFFPEYRELPRGLFEADEMPCPAPFVLIIQIEPIHPVARGLAAWCPSLSQQSRSRVIAEEFGIPDITAERVHALVP